MFLKGHRMEGQSDEGKQHKNRQWYFLQIGDWKSSCSSNLKRMREREMLERTLLKWLNWACWLPGGVVPQRGWWAWKTGKYHGDQNPVEAEEQTDPGQRRGIGRNGQQCLFLHYVCGKGLSASQQLIIHRLNEHGGSGGRCGTEI